MDKMRDVIQGIWKGFFWGPPSHKRIAWVGALAGVGVIALAAVVAGKGRPLFVLAMLLVGAAEFGWAAELLPRGWTSLAGWARLARWLCAVAGTVVAGLCLVWGLTPVTWFGIVIAGTGVLLALEMAPGGPANRPQQPPTASANARIRIAHADAEGGSLMMRTFDQVVGQELRWVRPKWTKRQFELRAGDGEAVVATLAWSRHSQAVGQWAGGQYRFRREGWLRPRTLVYGNDGEISDEQAQPVATFSNRGSTLTFSDGRTLLWKKPKRWTNERIWVDHEATELVRFSPSAWTASNGVTIQAAAAPQAEVALLLLLGEYLLVLAAEEAAATTAAAIVPVISG